MSKAYLTLTLISGLLLGACDKHADKPGESPLTLQAPTLTANSVAESGYTELAGTAAGERSVSLATKLMGEILEINAVVGQAVKKGDLLVRIDDADIQAMRAEAAAFRSEAQAARAEVDAVIAQGVAAKAQAEAAVNQAQEALADAKRDFDRAERLALEDSIPRAQRDKAELGYKVAKENVARAEAALDQAQAAIEQAKARHPQVAAKEQQADAKDQQAVALQSYATLASPFDGVVTGKYFERGQLSAPGQPILRIEQVSNFKVELSIPEALAAQLALGQEVEVLIDGADGIAESHMSTLTVLGERADPRNHTVHAELSIAPVRGLRSGAFVRCRLPGQERQSIYIPQGAVVHEGELAYVWRVSASGILAKAPLQVELQKDGSALVLRGLSNGDEIVAVPTMEMFAGAKISSTVSPNESQSGNGTDVHQ